MFRSVSELTSPQSRITVSITRLRKFRLRARLGNPLLMDRDRRENDRDCQDNVKNRRGKATAELLRDAHATGNSLIACRGSMTSRCLCVEGTSSVSELKLAL